MCSLAFSALMILGLLVACADSGGGDNGGSGADPVQTSQQNAVYVGERTEINPTLDLEMTTKMTATFKEDGTFSVSQKMKIGDQEYDFGVVMNGTYTGNAAVDETEFVRQ